MSINPADWYDGVLKNKMNKADATVAELANGELVFCHEREFTLKNMGHSICLRGDRVWLRMAPNPGLRCEYRALECQVQVIAGEERDTRAMGNILNWDGSKGAARMDCGCSIQVGMDSKDDFLDLQFWDRVEFDIYFSERLGKFLGKILRSLGPRRSATKGAGERE